MGNGPSTTVLEAAPPTGRRRGKPRHTRQPPPRFDALPHEVFSHMKAFLLGHDLLTLSHVSRRLKWLLANADLWAERMVNYDFNPWMYKKYLEDTAKMRYAQSRSFQFPGVSMDSKRIGVHDRGGCVALPRIVRPFHHDPISFDVWFSLLPPHASHDGRRVYTGGVIFGSQSDAPYARGWMDQHEHIIHVDMERNLYCSIMWQKPVVAAKLEFNRWYHVALSFDGEQERVFVDGELVHLATSRQLTAWSDLAFAQIGTGMLGTRSPGKPSLDFCGWYGFFGVIDDFRIWNSALSVEEVTRLARGHFVTTSPSYRLKRAVAATTCGRVQNVRCSRPMERVLEIIRSKSRRRALHKWLSKVKKNSTEGASCISIPV